jgi:hypothetical protein
MHVEPCSRRAAAAASKFNFREQHKYLQAVKKY